MIDEYLKKNGIKFTQRQYNDKIKYTLLTPVASKISDVLKTVTEMMKFVDNNEYVVVPIAKAGDYMVELSLSQSSMSWRIAKKMTYIDVTDKDIDVLMNVLQKLKNVKL
ncbi:hypothetical protein [Deltalipothrixvirus pozzuoliense]|uniref:Uncharacterized protein ORF108 n=1 Tax=Acidianus filamentous virus 2 (isolate Italy/Pozzuoli) TaxID=654910 RepID=Y108_AFV2P|nr:hypothetical protein AFV2_gp11 [Acidianus filamentous virus 2]Q573F8.1 RecName: Full=Uncharacterized protein ORF108 [Acidianus filamentous virus 2 (isolate Pozzuoli)]CAH69398.1 hypothetical protein [Acidianus filamentous virus 2]